MTKNKNLYLVWNDIIGSRTEIFGFVAIWIVLFHINSNIGFFGFPGAGIISKVISIGNAGVDIFLFLSAIGLCHSMSKNTTFVFYKNRTKRVVVPYLLLAIPFFVWLDLIFSKAGIGKFTLDLITINYWITGNYPLWYVAFIIVFYALFPIIYKLDQKTKHITTFCFLCAAVIVEYLLFISNNILYINAERALSRIPIFLFGILFSAIIPKLKDKNLALSASILLLLGLSIFVSFYKIAMPIVIKRYLYGVLAICIVFVYAFIRKVMPLKYLYLILDWLGNISFEIYIVHVFILRIIKEYNLWSLVSQKWFWYIVITTSSILLAKFVSNLTNKITNGWRQRFNGK